MMNKNTSEIFPHNHKIILQSDKRNSSIVPQAPRLWRWSRFLSTSTAKNQIVKLGYEDWAAKCRMLTVEHHIMHCAKASN